MNKMWVIKASSDSAVLGSKDVSHWDKTELKLGVPSKINWLPVEVELHRRGKTDFVYFGSGNILTCSDDCWHVLGEHISADAEGLELVSDKGSFYIVNAFVCENALDMSQSRVMRSPISGKVSVILKHVFVEDAIKDRLLFRLPVHDSDVYATEKFKTLAERLELKHLTFHPLMTVTFGDDSIRLSPETDEP